MVGPAIAHAQSADQPAAQANEKIGLGDIVVTAQRRSERLQDVPVAVTAFTPETIASSNVEGIGDLGVVAPSLTYSNTGGFSQPRLRGIGTTATGPGLESPVALYVDGVYYPGITSGAVPFFSVESVEVINGPQGTLFGRNATGGLIQVRTKDPTHSLAGALSAGYGNYNTLTGGLYLNGGITDTLAANIAVQVRNQADGFGRNLQTGTEQDKQSYFNIRGKLLFTPTDRLSIKLTGDYDSETGSPIVQNLPGSIPAGSLVPNTTDPHDINGPYDSKLRLRQGGVSGVIDYEADFARFTSTTAWRRTDFQLLASGGLQPGPATTSYLDVNEPHTQLSQEFQISSLSGSGLVWTLGAYYFREISRYVDTGLVGSYVGGALLANTRNVTDSLAFYGQATKELLPRTNLTLGLRYTMERRKYDVTSTIIPLGSSTIIPGGSGNDKADFKKPTWRIAVDHKFSDDVMGYISYNRGFKSGGFNPYQVPVQSFAPETLDAYEAGLKTQLFDRRLRLNIAGYYYDYKNIQVTGYPAGTPIISNGPKARLYGVDVDMEARVTRRFTLRAGISLEDATYRKFPNAPLGVPIPPNPADPAQGGGNDLRGTTDAKGNRVPYAPKFVGNVSGTYMIPTSSGNVEFTAAYLHNSGYFGDPDNRLRQSAFDVVNLNLSWKSNSGLGVEIWAKNIGDKDYLVALSRTNTADSVTYAQPRTYGFTLSKEF